MLTIVSSPPLTSGRSVAVIGVAAAVALRRGRVRNAGHSRAGMGARRGSGGGREAAGGAAGACCRRM